MNSVLPKTMFYFREAGDGDGDDVPVRLDSI